MLNRMMKQYGVAKGTRVFYSSINKKVPGSRAWHDEKEVSSDKNKFTEALA